MKKILVLTPWGGNGTINNPYKPKILIDYPFVKNFKDVTGSYNFKRNFFLISCNVDLKTYNKLRLNSDYFILKEETK